MPHVAAPHHGAQNGEQTCTLCIYKAQMNK